MKLSKVVYQMMTQLESLAAYSIRDNMLSMCDQQLLNGYDYILTEPARMSFYPEYTMVALRLKDYVGVVIVAESMGSERLFDVFDNGEVPLQDLHHLLSELDRVNPAKQDPEDEEQEEIEVEVKQPTQPVKKVCPEKIDGSCPLHNLHCQFPACEQ